MLRCFSHLSWLNSWLTVLVVEKEIRLWGSGVGQRTYMRITRGATGHVTITHRCEGGAERKKGEEENAKCTHASSLGAAETRAAI